MKKISLVLLTFVLSANLMMATDNKKVANAEFETIEYDFGKIPEKGGDVTTTFKFKNTGTAPLVIQDVRASCGCTKPTYPQKPILPGKEGEIAVTYVPLYRPGVFKKTIYVHSNVENKTYVLTINGEVMRDR